MLQEKGGFMFKELIKLCNNCERCNVWYWGRGSPGGVGGKIFEEDFPILMKTIKQA
jgi:hypothetical protein